MASEGQLSYKYISANYLYICAKTFPQICTALQRFMEKTILTPLRIEISFSSFSWLNLYKWLQSYGHLQIYFAYCLNFFSCIFPLLGEINLHSNTTIFTLLSTSLHSVVHKSQLHLIGWGVSLLIEPDTTFVRMGCVLVNRAGHYI